MGDATRRFRVIGTDRRIWGVTALLACWPAFGILTRTNAVLESATPLVYAYLFVLQAVGQGFPGRYPFWVGLVAFCFCIATVIVGAFDWARARRTPVGHPEQRSVE